MKGYGLNSGNPSLGWCIRMLQAVEVELISIVDIDVPVIHVNLFKELMRMKGSCKTANLFDPKGVVGTRNLKAVWRVHLFVDV